MVRCKLGVSAGARRRGCPYAMLERDNQLQYCFAWRAEIRRPGGVATEEGAQKSKVGEGEKKRYAAVGPKMVNETLGIR